MSGYPESLLALFIANLPVSASILRDTVGKCAGMLLVNVGHCLQITVGIHDLYMYKPPTLLTALPQFDDKQDHFLAGGVAKW